MYVRIDTSRSLSLWALWRFTRYREKKNPWTNHSKYGCARVARSLIIVIVRSVQFKRETRLILARRRTDYMRAKYRSSAAECIARLKYTRSGTRLHGNWYESLSLPRGGWRTSREGGYGKEFSLLIINIFPEYTQAVAGPSAFTQRRAETCPRHSGDNYNRIGKQSFSSSREIIFPNSWQQSYKCFAYSLDKSHGKRREKVPFNILTRWIYEIIKSLFK